MLQGIVYIVFHTKLSVSNITIMLQGIVYIVFQTKPNQGIYFCQCYR